MIILLVSASFDRIRPMTNKKVTLYSTPTCHFCHLVKDFFTQNKVDYTEFNVQSDLARRQEMIDKSDQMGVPVIAIADQEGKEDIVIGFEPGTLVELLSL